MKKLSILILTAFIAFAGCNQSGQKNSKDKNEHKTTQQDKKQDYKLVAKDYGFEITFPQKPTEMEDSYDYQKQKLKVKMYSFEDDSKILTVMVFQAPEHFAKQADPTATLKNFTLGFATKLSLIEENLSETTFNDYPCIDFSGKDEETPAYGKIKTIGTDNFIYLITALKEGQDAKTYVETKGKKFINSFKLLN